MIAHLSKAVCPVCHEVIMLEGLTDGDEFVGFCDNCGVDFDRTFNGEDGSISTITGRMSGDELLELLDEADYYGCD